MPRRKTRKTKTAPKLKSTRRGKQSGTNPRTDRVKTRKSSSAGKGRKEAAPRNAKSVSKSRTTAISKKLPSASKAKPKAVVAAKKARPTHKAVVKMQKSKVHRSTKIEAIVPNKAVQPVLAPPPVLVQITHELIAQRAKEIWERKGMPVGLDDQNWAEAEAELRAHRIKKSSVMAH